MELSERELIESGAIKSRCREAARLQCPNCGDTSHNAEQWAAASNVCPICEGGPPVIQCIRCGGALGSVNSSIERSCQSLETYRATGKIAFEEEAQEARRHAEERERTRLAEERRKREAAEREREEVSRRAEKEARRARELEAERKEKERRVREAAATREAEERAERGRIAREVEERKTKRRERLKNIGKLFIFAAIIISGFNVGKPLYDSFRLKSGIAHQGCSDFTTANVLFGADAKEFATACGDGTIQIIDSLNGSVLRKITGIRGDSQISLAMSTNPVYVAESMGSKIAVWNSQGGLERTINYANGVIINIDISHDGQYIAALSSTEDGKSESLIWWVSDGRLLAKIKFPLDVRVNPGSNIKFSPDGNHVVINDGFNVGLWNIATSKQIRELDKSTYANNVLGPVEGGVEALDISSDGKLVALARSNRKIQLIETDSGHLVKELDTDLVDPSNPGRISSLSFDPSGKYLAYGAMGGSFKSDATINAIAVININTGSVVKYHEGTGNTTSLTFSPDGKYLAARQSGNRIWIWSTP